MATKRKKRDSLAAADDGSVAPEGATSGDSDAASGSPQESADQQKVFSPYELESTIIALPLLQDIQKKGGDSAKHDVIIDVNLEYPGDSEHSVGRVNAKVWILKRIDEIGAGPSFREDNRVKNDLSPQYLFGTLTGRQICALVKADSPKARADANEPIRRSAIYHVWPDFEIQGMIAKSIRTVKADAARSSFSALGEDVAWAIVDSGIDATHPHFGAWENLKGLTFDHQDFTGGTSPLTDEYGHGTHVAGIVAGELTEDWARKTSIPSAGAEGAARPSTGAMDGSGVSTEQAVIRAVSWQRDETGKIVPKVDTSLKSIAGMAPKCRLLSLKVLDKNGAGKASNLIAALAYVQEVNGYGRRILIHGVNMSVGYNFEPKWFACGQSPLCVEVDKLVRSGVVVVTAAGNTGYGTNESEAKGASKAGQDITINDPGNAQLAITVGSTHRDMPHTYGVSYFSSKGPTGDGRLKPDLVAPGEKITSCAAGALRDKAGHEAGDCNYLEHSGTSMAAPHVSGVIAAFLSIRREFIGNPERVKEIFLSSAIDLKRERYFQGHGLVDLMRAIQSV